MSTSNDAWNGFNVTMSISQSLDDEDLNVAKKTTNIGSPVQCKKIVFSLGENFKPPLAVAFMWDGAELYYNYFKDQRNAKKIYALNFWDRFPLEDETFMDTSYVRVLYKLAVKGELDNDEKKLLMFSIINNIYKYLYDVPFFNEDNPTTDCDSLKTFIDGMSQSALYKKIHDKIKSEPQCTKEEFVEAMNNFFTKKQEEANEQQNNQNLNTGNSTNNFNYGYDNNKKNEINNNEHDDNGYCDKFTNKQKVENKQPNNQNLNTDNNTNNFNHGYDNNKKNEINNNGYCDKCITGLGNCWNSVKSCFGGE